MPTSYNKRTVNRYGSYFESASRAAQKGWKYLQDNPQVLRVIKRFGEHYLKNPSKRQKKMVSSKKTPRTNNAYLGGFSAKRIKRRGKSDIWGKFCKRGIVQVRQAGAVRGDSICLWVGHISHPISFLIDVMAQALVKHLVSKAGHESNDVDKIVFGTSSHFYRFNFYANATGLIGSTSTAVVAAGNTLAFSAAALATTIANFASATDVTFTTLELVITNDTIASMSLGETIFSTISRSDLKLQNRTLKTATDDEVDVNNYPLNGKLYEAKGNQAVLAKPKYGAASTTFFTGDNITGTFFYAGSTDSSNIMTEPQDKGMFVGCKQCVKVRVNPGKLITSSLTVKQGFTFNNFIKMMQGALTGILGRNLGRYRVYALEKTMSAETPATEGSISCGTETQTKIGVLIKERKNTFTGIKKSVYY